MRKQIIGLASGVALAAALLLLAGVTEAAETQKGDVYALDTCPVLGTKLGSMEQAVKYDYKGRQVRFCCKGCISQFKADPEKYLKKVDEAQVKQQLPFYPLKADIVSGAPLEKGTAIDYIHNNRLVRLASKESLAAFKEEPDKYLAKLDEAVIAKQKAAYPLGTCLVSGAELDSMGGGVDYVTGDRLVRFCCRGCVATFEKDPAKYLSKLDEAAQEK